VVVTNDDGFESPGTVGAARMATYYGVPSIALSGVDNGDPAAVAAVVRWVVKLARSDIARALKPPQYLTVSFPRDAFPAPSGSDAALVAQGKIVIVPMRVD
jgi:broad specificity polyphosphatase/5'/3'-nucleotidase SurE